jgi:redox-sensitive bicupin YhaK (pirin superfamily)
VYHAFSFGAHYDPHNTGFGALVAHNDEHLPPGTGYADHPHLDTEIVTVVLSGALRHRDSTGTEHVLGPGEVQRLSAGSGVVHAETSAATDETRFIQAWVRPDEAGLEPSYVRGRANGTAAGELHCVASGDGEYGVPLHARGVAFHVATLDAGQEVLLPDASRLHLFVTAGGLLVGERMLVDGATARLVDEGGRRVGATDDGTRLLVWALP